MDRKRHHGPYEVLVNSNGPMTIRRQDEDHKRTVCFIENLKQWNLFVKALTSGASEVDAVHAIDAPAERGKGNG